MLKMLKWPNGVLVRVSDGCDGSEVEMLIEWKFNVFGWQRCECMCGRMLKFGI